MSMFVGCPCCSHCVAWPLSSLYLMHLASVLCVQLSCLKNWSHIETSQVVSVTFGPCFAELWLHHHSQFSGSIYFSTRSVWLSDYPKRLVQESPATRSCRCHAAMIRNDRLLRRRPIETLYTDKSKRSDLAVEYLWHEKKEKTACLTAPNWFWWG